jgi:hypothetical protein
MVPRGCIGGRELAARHGRHACGTLRSAATENARPRRLPTSASGRTRLALWSACACCLKGYSFRDDASGTGLPSTGRSTDCPGWLIRIASTARRTHQLPPSQKWRCWRRSVARYNIPYVKRQNRRNRRRKDGQVWHRDYYYYRRKGAPDDGDGYQAIQRTRSSRRPSKPTTPARSTASQKISPELSRTPGLGIARRPILRTLLSLQRRNTGECLIG